MVAPGKALPEWQKESWIFPFRHSVAMPHREHMDWKALNTGATLKRWGLLKIPGKIVGVSRTRIILMV